MGVNHRKVLRIKIEFSFLTDSSLLFSVSSGLLLQRNETNAELLRLASLAIFCLVASLISSC